MPNEIVNQEEVVEEQSCSLSSLLRHESDLPFLVTASIEAKKQIKQTAYEHLLTAWRDLETNPSYENILSVRYWFGEADLPNSTIVVFYSRIALEDGSSINRFGQVAHITMQLEDTHYSKTFHDGPMTDIQLLGLNNNVR
jgi:hypothetical protein